MKLEIRAEFLLSALLLELPARKALAKMIQVARVLPMGELLRHEGVHLEKIPGHLTDEGEPLYTLRVTRAVRAAATLHEGTLVLLYVETDHDKVYS